MKPIAVEGMTISHGAGSPAAGGTFSITTLPSTTVFLEGSAVYRGTVAFNWSGGTYLGNAATGSGTITVTATKVLVDGSLVLREDDTGEMSGSYTNPSPPPATIAFANAPVVVSNAGQTRGRAT